MLAGALAASFSVLVLEGLDRLSRDQVENERIVRRLEHRGIRLVGVSDGYDSASGKGRKILRGVRGLLNEVYLDDLGDKVHRSLSSKAARGKHVAGLSYGFRSIADGDDRRLEVVSDEAAVVRELFSRYAAGESCQRIAHDLNRRGIRGPRGHTWSVSALYGSPRKLAGILNNPLYIGEYFWNRSRWVKDPDTGQRQRTERPRTEWQVTSVPELAIVDSATWSRVRKRIGEGGKRGGGWPHTLFGGLLRCGLCGGAMIAVDAGYYGCAARKDRGKAVCAGTRTPRKATDVRLLASIRDQLSGPGAIAQVRQDAEAAISGLRESAGTRTARLATLDREIARLTDAVAAMGLSDALRARLAAAEAARKELLAQPVDTAVTVSAIVSRYRELLLRLEQALAGDVERARAALRQTLGKVTVGPRRGSLGDCRNAAGRHGTGGRQAGFGCGGAQMVLATPRNQVLGALVIVRLGDRIIRRSRSNP